MKNSPAFRLCFGRVAPYLVLVVALLCPVGAWAALESLNLQVPETVPEGTAFTVHVSSTEPLQSATIHWLGKTIPLQLEDGGTSATALLGIGMTEKIKGKQFTLALEATAGGTFRRMERTVTRMRHDYPEQRLKVARKYTSLSKKALQRHRNEKKLVTLAKNRVSETRRWSLPLTLPVEGRVSSAFGLRRFFNGEPRSPHSGLDIAAPAGTPVKACADGTVILTGNHYFAGNSVYVDHGQGVISMYFHLSEIDVSSGSTVKAGQVLGKVGQTGRVTGPHLHLSISAQGQLVDPTPLLPELR